MTLYFGRRLFGYQPSSFRIDAAVSDVIGHKALWHAEVLPGSKWRAREDSNL